MAPTAAHAPAPGRSRANRGSEQVRGRLIEAGIAAFAANGFTGASTRAIAERADAHQSQIKYHFESKDELWRRCLEQLLSELDATIARFVGDGADDGPAAEVEATIRGLVRFAADRPELNRIMMHEATSPSDRLSWLVSTHLEARFATLSDAWSRLAASGRAAPIDAAVLYHTLVGAASLLYANAPEARLLGVDVDDPALVARHADALIAMFLIEN